MRRKDMIGRTIVDVRLRHWRDVEGTACTDPVFVLDSGAEVSFYVQETVDPEYGIGIVYTPPAKKKRAS